MSDLLKEAIADAKAVRETALQNAKMALEEAFTPHLKSMLSAKLSEDDVEEGYHDREEDDEEKEEGMGDSDRPREEDDEEQEEGMHDSDRPREDDDEEMDEIGHEDDEEEEVDESEIIEIDGVKYAPVVSEEEHEDEDEDMDESEELDLESVIKELETEIAESEESDDDLTEDDKEEVEEVVTEEDDEDDDKDEVDEQSKSSGIGAGDNKVAQASAGDEEDPGKGKIKESVEAMQEELNEYKEAVVYLKDKLHEVNILNAKLLFTNRLFKEFVLSNDQKMKVVETFDRAQTTREIKLVYSTLAESFNDRGEINKKRSVKESASRKTNTTKPQTKIISEEDNVANRFKKLAGILKD
jgi:hypothetical protein